MRVWIGRDTFSELIAQAERFSPLETGGVLMGWREGSDRIVAGLIGPGPRALHGRHMFLPDHAWQIDQIDRAFARTNGDLDYLGDWHTHPDGVAQMSEIDRRTLQKLGRKVPDAVMLIGAQDEGGWTANAWHQPRGRLFQSASAQDCEIILMDAPKDWPRLGLAEND